MSCCTEDKGRGDADPICSFLDAPAGMSQAVIVERMPLVHTRQLFPLDREGKLVGEGSADQQIEQVLANLEAVLKDSGSGLDKLIRLNVYALSNENVAARVREHLDANVSIDAVRPAITSVLTPLRASPAPSWPSMRSPGPPTAARRWR